MVIRDFPNYNYGQSLTINGSDSLGVLNITGGNDSTSIDIGDNVDQWQTGDAIELQDGGIYIGDPPYVPWQPQPLQPAPVINPWRPLGPVYPGEVNPFGADPNQQVFTWPPPVQEKKLFNAEELMEFLKTLDCVEPEVMTKIKKALFPDQKPIDYSNRIDDLILDIEMGEKHGTTDEDDQETSRSQEA